MQAAGVGQGYSKSSLELPLSRDPRADSTHDQVAEPFIGPFVDVVEGAFENFSLGGVASIIQYNNNGCLPMSYSGRKLCTSHLKRAIADQHDRSKRGVGKRSADCCWNGKSHRGVIGWGEKLEPPMDMEVGCGKE